MFSKTCLVALLVICTINLCKAVEADKKPGTDCSDKFNKDYTKHSEAFDVCMKKLNISIDTIPKDEKEFTKDFNDQCYGHCFMTEMGFIKDGTFNKEEMEKDIKMNVKDETLQKTIHDYTMKCLEKSEEALKSKGGKLTKDNECRLCAEFMYCSSKEADKLEMNC